MTQTAMIVDAQLMVRTAEGDRDAFGFLVERHKDSLVNYLTHLAGTRERAEEIAQEAFLRLFRGARGYEEQGRFAPYLYRIATNLVRSEQRRERRWRLLFPRLASSVPGAPRSAGDPSGPPREILAAEVQSVVSRAIAELPLRYRVPLVLHEIEGWPYKRIARLQRCHEGTVKSRIHRARSRLKERLAPYWNGGSRS